ncbi:MAG: rhomboid family intramembrane serine protease [Defluviitaleaceae bacterium]|nr:rhomboid family intramembrane serine protease [Defluviitaleaceae bacterium]
MKILKKVKFNSPVILWYTLLSFAVLCLSWITSGRSNELLFSVYRSSWADPLAYIRVFGYALGHADFNHFLGNFMTVLLVGPLLEERYGGVDIIIMMAVTALITGVSFLILNPHGALIGASGVVFMLILLASVTNAQRGQLPLTLVLALAIFIGQEISREIAATGSNISYVTHIIGGMCGAAFGMYLRKAKKK